MKLNKLFLAGFCIPFLLGCAGKAKYDGAKIVLKYVENGSLITSSASEMYTMTVANKESNVFILGDDQCGNCKEAKRYLLDYAVKNHCNFYYLNVDKFTKDDLTKVQKATAGNYMYGEKGVSNPTIYFVFNGDVAFSCGYSDLDERIKTYVTVEDPLLSVN